MVDLSYIIGVSILAVSCIIIVYIKEKGKDRRLKEFNKMDNSKIEAAGNYEKNSKSEVSFINVLPIKKDSSLRSE